MFLPAASKNKSSNCLMYLNTEMKSEVQGQLNKIATRWHTMYDTFPRFLRQMKEQKQFIIHAAKQFFSEVVLKALHIYVYICMCIDMYIS